MKIRRISYSTAARALAAAGIAWMAVWVIGRWVLPQVFSRPDRAYALHHWVAFRIYSALGVGLTIPLCVSPVFIWCEYRLSRLGPSSNARRILVMDLVWYATFLIMLAALLKFG